LEPELTNKKRVNCYIDGFNLYHSIVELGKNFSHLKWLNLWALSNAYIKPSIEQLNKVYYFSAIAKWLKRPSERHKNFIKAIEHYGVITVFGEFKKRNKSCRKCNCKWTEHEEKQSDVNLAVYLINDAHLNSFDKAFIISADSDLCPAIDLVIKHTKKEVEILLPPARYRTANQLRNQATGYHKIKEKHLKENQLPDKIKNETGKIIMIRPIEYSKVVAEKISAHRVKKSIG